MLKIKRESHICFYDFDSKTTSIIGDHSHLHIIAPWSGWRKYWFSDLFSLRMKDLVPRYQEEGLETLTISLTTKQQAFCFKKVPFYSQNEHFKRISISRNTTCYGVVEKNKSPNLRSCCETKLLSALLLPTKGFESDPLSL